MISAPLQVLGIAVSWTATLLAVLGLLHAAWTLVLKRAALVPWPAPFIGAAAAAFGGSGLLLLGGVIETAASGEVPGSILWSTIYLSVAVTLIALMLMTGRVMGTPRR
jgi:hypothetical protein